MTKRELISLLRNKLKEVDADSIYTNKFLFYSLQEHATWLLRREWYTGKLLRSVGQFQKLSCLRTEEVDKSDCPDFLKSYTVYRTVCHIPKMWHHDTGPMIVRVSSIDNFTEFTLITSTSSENKNKSPYKKYFTDKYCYYEGGYLYFTQDPHRISVRGFFRENVSAFSCDGTCAIDCSPYLDTEFFLPEWMTAELVEKTFSTLFNTKKLPNDENINSNSTIIN